MIFSSMSSETTSSTGFYELLAWLETHRKQLIVAAAAIAVAGCGIALYRWKSNQTEWAANEALLNLRPPPGAGETPSEPLASDYLKIVNAYPKTDAAERALFLAAGALFSEGKYSEAQAQFGQFLREHENHSFAASAALGVAASLESQGRTEEALTAYQHIVTRYPKAAVVDNAKLAMARLYEAKKQPQQALKLYNELVTPTARTPLASEATTRKDALLSAHPELAKTNAPSATVPPPGAKTNVTETPARNAATSAPPSLITNAPAPAPSITPGPAPQPPPTKP